MNFAEVLETIEWRLSACSASIEQLIMQRGGHHIQLVRIAFIAACANNDIPLKLVADRLERDYSTVFRQRQRHEDYVSTNRQYRSIYEILSKPGAGEREVLNKRGQATTASPQRTTTGHRVDSPGAFYSDEAPCNNQAKTGTPEEGFPPERIPTISYPPEGIL